MPLCTLWKFRLCESAICPPLQKLPNAADGVEINSMSAAQNKLLAGEDDWIVIMQGQHLRERFFVCAAARHFEQIAAFCGLDHKLCLPRIQHYGSDGRPFGLAQLNIDFTTILIHESTAPIARRLVHAPSQLG